MKKFKIFMVGYSPSYVNWFPFPYEITVKPQEANVAWWVGGADIDVNTITGEKEGSHTYVDYHSSKNEIAAWNYFKDRKDVFKGGTCKGLQNLACFNGAKMVQHSIHPGRHEVFCKNGKSYFSNSLHHQQIILDEKITGLKENEDYELIGWTKKLSPFHLNGKDEDYEFPENYKEPEIAYFSKTKCWGVQGHPEMMGTSSDYVKFCQQILIEKLKESGIYKS